MKESYLELSTHGMIFTPIFFQHALHHFLHKNITVQKAEYLPFAGEKISDEIKNPKSKNHPIGIQKYKLNYQIANENHKVDVIVKSKINDDKYLDSLDKTFTQLEIKTLQPLKNYFEKLGFTYVNQRELAIYEWQNKYPSLKKIMPPLLGYYVDEACGANILILQDIADDYLSTNALDTSTWNEQSINAAIDAISEAHALWLNKPAELNQKLFKYYGSTTLETLLPFWESILRVIKKQIGASIQQNDYHFFYQLIEDLPTWAMKMDDYPKTLVHNDFMPKNIGMRLNDKHYQCYIYNWEIAKIHLPQRDLVELLVYTLPEKFSKETLLTPIDHHRKTLEKKSNQKLSQYEWLLGYRYTLYDYMLQRVSLSIPLEKIEPKNISKIMRTVQQMLTYIPEE